MVLRVPFDDLDERDELTCAHNMFIEVYYQDARFTGIGFEEHEGTVTEVSYVDGNGHGRCTTIAADGQLLEEFFLDHGDRTGDERRWFDGGQLEAYRHHDRPELTRRWSEAGALIEERTEHTWVEWFADGGLRVRRIGEVTELFVRSGARVLTCRPRAIASPIYAGYDFDEAMMDAHLEDLAADPQREYDAFAWVHAVLARDRDRGAELVARLLAHPSLWIVTTAMRIVGASRILGLVDRVRARLDDERVPPPEQHAGGGRSATRSVASVAREVLAQLAKLDREA